MSAVVRAYLGLMGSKDGHASFSKHLIVAVLLAFVCGHALPVSIAYLLVVASFGSKALLAWLDTKPAL